jgi:hypothetical protein
MREISAYAVKVAQSPDGGELQLEAASAVEAAVRAFAHFTDGWPETMEVVRRSPGDCLTMKIGVGPDELILIVRRLDPLQ